MKFRALVRLGLAFGLVAGLVSLAQAQTTSTQTETYRTAPVPGQASDPGPLSGSNTVIIERAQSSPMVIHRSQACQGLANGAYCGLADNHQQYFECSGGGIVNQRNCPGGCDQATRECRQMTGVKSIDNMAPQKQ